MRTLNQLLTGLAVIACGAALFAPSAMADQKKGRTFVSPQQASNALFVAAQNNDEAQLVEILGGKEQIVSTDDKLSDQQERELFAQKYQEMHRLMRRSDGAMILYVGAENWPFPVPIVSKNGRWYFDADTGSKEILYRRVGANEIAAIETCHALVQNGKANPQPTPAAQSTSNSQSAEDDAVAQFAHQLLSKQQAATPENPFSGYFFHKLNGSENDGAAYIAYPAEYRSSGVMTFIVTHDDKVYEKDLGPKTVTDAKNMTDWKPDKSWYPAE